MLTYYTCGTWVAYLMIKWLKPDLDKLERVLAIFFWPALIPGVALYYLAEVAIPTLARRFRK